MKHSLLRFCAYFLVVLAVLVGIVGVAGTLLLGISMSAVTAKIAAILVGFIITAIFVIILLAVSQLWLLFLRMEENLAALAATLKSKTGD